MSGQFGRFSWPTALHTASNSSDSPVPFTTSVQTLRSSSNVTDSTSVENRMSERRSSASATHRK
jgi:hypothetical protein